MQAPLDNDYIYGDKTSTATIQAVAFRDALVEKVVSAANDWLRENARLKRILNIDRQYYGDYTVFVIWYVTQ